MDASACGSFGPWARSGWKLVNPRHRASATSGFLQCTCSGISWVPIYKPVPKGRISSWVDCTLTAQAVICTQTLGFMVRHASCYTMKVLWDITNLCFCRCSQTLIYEHRKTTRWVSRKASHSWVCGGCDKNIAVVNSGQHSVPINSDKKIRYSVTLTAIR